VERTGIFKDSGGGEAQVGSAATAREPRSPLGRWEQILTQEVRAARREPQFLQALADYEIAVGLKEGIV
jgi:hypothetical protein